MSDLQQPRLLIAVNTAEFFLSHRLHLANGARDAGWDVWILCPPSPAISEIKGLGFSVVDVAIGRKSMNPFSEIGTLRLMYRAIKEINPQIYHGFTVKPVLYGTFICRLLKVPQIVNTITGLGFLFISNSPPIKVVRAMVGGMYRLLFASPNVKIIFQNEDDQKIFVSRKWVAPDQSVVIKGTGVDLKRFSPSLEPDSDPVIVFPARLLIDKGIRELIHAAEILANNGCKFVLELCGREDPGNPSALTSSEIESLRKKEPQIRVRGHVTDMAAAMKAAHIVCLPSYREGVPLALIEACASGRPIVTTNVPGCRAVVKDGVEGYLVPSQNSTDLAAALETLLRSKELRLQMGSRARARAIREFDKDVIVQKNLELYGAKPKTVKAAA